MDCFLMFVGNGLSCIPLKKDLIAADFTYIIVKVDKRFADDNSPDYKNL
jgi:hypothetical protein